MATNVKVVSTDLRQATIKVDPDTYLTQVLELACKKFSLPPDKFLLKYKQKQLDLSNTFRNASLVPGARLELVAKSSSPSVLNIALEIPESEAKLFGSRRATEKLPNDYTLWKVLRHFETHTCKGKGVNLTARGVPQMDAGGSSGQLYYETPVLQVEKRSFATFVDFQKTMSQLGYNGGSVLIRLTFQKTDKTLVDAMSDISQYFQEDGARLEGKQATDTITMAESAPVVKESNTPTGPLPESTSLDTTTTLPPGKPQPDHMDIDTPPTDGLAPVQIFSAPSNSTPAAAHTTESDETYQIGIVHAQQHQHRLKTAGQNKRLPSDKELEEKAAAEEARLNAIKAIDIKVRFPDNTSAAWRMGPEAAGETLYAAVRRVMADDKLKFKLLVPGSKDKITDDGSKLIKDHGLGGSTLVTLYWDESVPTELRAKPFLKGSVASRATDIVIPQVPEVEVEEDETGPSVRKPAEKPKHEGDVNKKLSKWLKLGKK